MRLRFSRHKIALALSDIILIAAGFSIAFWYIFESGFYGPPRQYPVYFVPSIVVLLVIFISVFQLDRLYQYQTVMNPFTRFRSC